MHQGQFSHAPTILRHWIPLEFSKEVADYSPTKPSSQTVRHNREASAHSRSDLKMFRNEKLYQKLEEAKVKPQFKLVFKNKSCKLFEPRQKIRSGKLIKTIVKGHLQGEHLESRESAMYSQLYDSGLDKHYIYRYVGAEKPRSSFSVAKRKSTAASCDLRKSEAEPQTKRVSLTTAMNSQRDSRTLATRQNERRISWLLGDNDDPRNLRFSRSSQLMVSGVKARKGQILEHWKLKQAEILNLMKRIKIL